MVIECKPALISELDSSHNFSVCAFTLQSSLLGTKKFIQGIAKDFTVFGDEKQMVPERQALQTLQ